MKNVILHGGFIIIISIFVSCNKNPSNPESKSSIMYDHLYGKIVAQTSAHDILTINANTKTTNKISTQALISNMSLSPTGDSIVFAGAIDIPFELDIKKLFIISADGKNETLITKDERWYSKPVWSHDGNHIFYCLGDGLFSVVHRISRDGKHDSKITNFGIYYTFSLTKDSNYIIFSNQREINLYNIQDNTIETLASHADSLTAYCPVISPNETKIAYLLIHAEAVNHFQEPNSLEIILINANGSEQKSVIELPLKYFYSKPWLTWSPGGDKIAFSYSIGRSEYASGSLSRNIFTINPDGTDLTQITYGNTDYSEFYWIE